MVHATAVPYQMQASIRDAQRFVSADRLSAPSNMLVVGNVVQTISSAPVAAPPATSVCALQEVGARSCPA